jgi:hypothetical protein
MAVVDSTQQRAAIRARWERTARERAAKTLTDWTRDRSAAVEPLAPHEVAAIVGLAAVIDARVRADADARNGADEAVSR